RVYQIWQQQQAASCGVASAWMARGIARQMSFAEEEWDLAQRVYGGAISIALAHQRSGPSAPMTLDPSAHANNQNSFGNTFSQAGMSTRQLAIALRHEGLQVEHYANNGNPIVVIPDKIAYNKPGIAFVQWSGVNGGAHFVVIGRAVPRNISF